MILPEPVLDHVVVNVRGTLDEASERYRRLGFRLTERGHHSLGSSNHLAVFGQNYLELLGFEPGRGTERADLWKHPVGLTGLVFKTGDALAVHSALVSAGVPVENPVEFSRPVVMPEGTANASFRVVRLGTELVPNGRVFFCQHFTPDLIWNDSWRLHPNGVLDVTGFDIATVDPGRTVELYRTMFGPHALSPTEGGYAMQAGTAQVRFLTPGEIVRRFGDAAPSSDDGSDRMVALTLRTRSLDMAARALSADIPGLRKEPGRVVVPHDQAFGVALAFIE